MKRNRGGINIELQVGICEIRNESIEMWLDKITICIDTNNIIGGLLQNFSNETKYEIK